MSSICGVNCEECKIKDKCICLIKIKKLKFYL